MSFDRARFVKLLGRLGSDQPGEVANAASMVTAMLRDAGLTWADCILNDPKPAPAKGERPQSRDPDWMDGYDVYSPVGSPPPWADHPAYSPGYRPKQDPPTEEEIRRAKPWPGPRMSEYDPANGPDATGVRVRDSSGRTHVFHLGRAIGKTYAQELREQARAAGVPEADIDQMVDALARAP